MNRLIGLSLVALLLPVFAFGQGGRGDQRRGQQRQQGDHQHRQGGQSSPRGGDRGMGGEYVPAWGPAPVRTSKQAAAHRRDAAATDRRGFRDQPRHFEAPQVHGENDAWMGHSTGRNDPNYRLGHHWGQRDFSGPIGRQHLWRLRGGRRDRFNVDGFFFQVAPYDAGYYNDWLWDNDDIVLYADPDHDGGYLAYNVRLGTYVHVTYLGS
jgi:hypothetical protein